MNSKKLNRNILLIVAGLILLIAVPSASFAQGRSRDRDQRKSDRFVNGHDARDGRWDRRGPRSARGSVISNVIRHRRRGRFRNRDFDRDQRLRNRRFEMRRRNFDNDNFLRSQRLRRRQLHRRGY